MRVEVVALAFGLVCWPLVLLDLAGVPLLAGTLEVGLYGYYSLAASAGWLAGNLYLWRRPVAKGAERRRSLLTWLAAASGGVALVWAMTPEVARRAVPLALPLGLAIFGVFFLVPLTLSGSRPARKGR